MLSDVPSEEDLANLLSNAEKLTREAADFVSKRSREHTTASLLANDVKLQIDSETQSFLAQRLLDLTKIPVVGEEDFSSPPPADLYWLLDPIDGSFNLWAGLPHATVSLALMHGETPLVGVVEDIFSRDQFSAYLNGGFRRDNNLLTPPSTPRTGLVLSAFSPPMHSRDSSLDSFLQQILSFRKVRMLGSASLSLTYLARGLCDAVILQDIHAWDVMAGCAIAKEAGCKVDWQLHDPSSMLGNLSAYRVDRINECSGVHS